MTAPATEQIPETMKAVICHGPENYQLEEVAVPRPGPGEALVKVEAVGICASDLKCYHGAAKFWGDANRPAWAETEVIPGHEFVGTIVQIDDQAGTRWNVAVGDRVIAEQDRQADARAHADMEFLAREVASLRMAVGEVATRDYVRSELRSLLSEIEERLPAPDDEPGTASEERHTPSP